MKIVLWFLFLIQSFRGCFAAVVGIDFGTHYAKEMVVSLKAPLEIVLNPESKRKDPSAVAIRVWEDQDVVERFYGTSATALASRFPSTTFMHLKSLLGKHYEDNLYHYHREHPGHTFLSDGSRNAIAFAVGDKMKLSVEELVAMSLRQYVHRANQLLRESDDLDLVKSAALAIPEYFNQEQRTALLDAAYLAGIHNTYLCNDAIAVAIDYASRRRNFPPGKTQYYVIYDMGAGSTTASLVSISQPENDKLPLNIEFLGYGHLESLSGSALTLAIADILENDFLESHPSIRTEQFESKTSAKAKLVQAAEKAKLVLSANSEASISIESLFDNIDFKTAITRKKFEEFVADLQADVMTPVFTALETAFMDQKVTVDDLDSVILTGGSTRVPFVKEQLELQLSRELISMNVNSDESAVNGAAVRGVQLSKEFKTLPMNITDRSTHSFGISIQDTEYSEEVFIRGASYPQLVQVKLPVFEELGKNSLRIDLTQNQRVFKTVAADFNKLYEKNFRNCSSEIVYSLSLALSGDQLFDLTEISASCVGGEAIAEGANTTANATETHHVIEFAVPFTEEYTCVKPLTDIEKRERLNSLRKWDQKDNLRLERQALLNDLESSIYSARELIEDASDLQNPPLDLINDLYTMTESLLEVIENPSTLKTKDIRSKKANLQLLRKKLETFLNHADDPLDLEQFETLLTTGEKMLKSVNETQTAFEKDLAPLAHAFEAIDLDVKQEYYKLQPPKSKKVSASLFNSTLTNLNVKLNELHEIVNDISSSKKEELLEHKLSFESILSRVEELLTKMKAEHSYRLKLLRSLFERKSASLQTKTATTSTVQSTTNGSSNKTETGDDYEESIYNDSFEQDEL